MTFRSRRAFVAAFAVVVLGALSACAGEGPVPGPRVDRSVPVMGTVLHVSAWAADQETAGTAAEAGRAAVFRVDSLMSNYKPDSEISRLNDVAGTGRWTPLSPWTIEVLNAALTWARRSQGAFDPTVGPLMKAWGFFQHEPGRPDPDALVQAEALVGWEGVTVDSTGARARLERSGMQLDFGALAKGFALDRALEAMREAGATSALADLGGNVSVFGTPPGADSLWVLGIRHPRTPGDLMGTVAVRSGSVATSGDYEQMFEDAGVRYSHIMDPTTGEPAQGVVAVTVAADDGMTADALSTLLFVLGPDRGRAFVERYVSDGRVTALWVEDAGDAPLDAGHVRIERGGGVRVHLDLPGGDESAGGG